MKMAFWQEPNTNSQMDIIRMDEDVCSQDRLQDSEVLTFENEKDAVQYLSDLLGKKIKIKDE